jgi:hypothetical protein
MGWDGMEDQKKMPVSKKPRPKVASTRSSKAASPPALPDRRVMESFLSAITGRGGDSSTSSVSGSVRHGRPVITSATCARPPIRHGDLFEKRRRLMAD